MLTALYADFPDWSYAYDGIEDRGQGNNAIKWRQDGIHTGIWAMPGMEPIEPTGKTVRILEHYVLLPSRRPQADDHLPGMGCILR